MARNFTALIAAIPASVQYLSEIQSTDVIPAKAGIQTCFHEIKPELDPGLRRDDIKMNPYNE
jgi:hypothetical protein